MISYSIRNKSQTWQACFIIAFLLSGSFGLSGLVSSPGLAGRVWRQLNTGRRLTASRCEFSVWLLAAPEAGFARERWTGLVIHGPAGDGIFLAFFRPLKGSFSL